MFRNRSTSLRLDPQVHSTRHRSPSFSRVLSRADSFDSLSKPIDAHDLSDSLSQHSGTSVGSSTSAWKVVLHHHHHLSVQEPGEEEKEEEGISPRESESDRSSLVSPSSPSTGGVETTKSPVNLNPVFQSKIDRWVHGVKGKLKKKKFAQEKQRVDDLIRSGLIVAEASAEELVTLDYRKQCNLDFYTEDMMDYRENLREHEGIKQVVREFWNLVKTPHEPKVMRENYLVLSMHIVRSLLPKCTEEEAQQMAEEDWVEDAGSRSATSIDKSRFFSCLFELADVWVDSVDAEEYIDFLKTLLLKIDEQVRRDLSNERKKLFSHQLYPLSEEASGTLARSKSRRRTDTVRAFVDRTDNFDELDPYADIPTNSRLSSDSVAKSHSNMKTKKPKARNSSLGTVPSKQSESLRALDDLSSEMEADLERLGIGSSDSLSSPRSSRSLSLSSSPRSSSRSTSTSSTGANMKKQQEKMRYAKKSKRDRKSLDSLEGLSPSSYVLERTILSRAALCASGEVSCSSPVREICSPSTLQCHSPSSLSCGTTLLRFMSSGRIPSSNAAAIDKTAEIEMKRLFEELQLKSIRTRVMDHFRRVDVSKEPFECVFEHGEEE